MSTPGGPKHVSWLRRLLASPVKAMGLASVVLFLWAVAHFYDARTGFSSLISIGDKVGDNKVSQLRQVPHFIYEESWGYDGAYYVQLALNPTLDNPELTKAIDNLPYRARRILFCWAAWVLGVGQPAWIVQAHALINVLCWLALAWVLLRWFPLTGWENFLRWFAVMFSHGICMSVRDSLVDGPSLLLVALAMRWVEEGRRGAGLATLALGGLGKETSLLAVAGVADVDWKAPSTWWRPVLAAVAVAFPLFLWMAYIRWKFGPADDTGLGNFTLPLSGLAEKWGTALAELTVRGDSTSRWATLAVVVALTVQWLFFLLRWRPNDPWWRIGAAYAGMLLFLSTPVWEGAPGAATRVLLPMTLAFNILVPRGRKWLPLLVAGNLTVVAAYREFSPPAHEFFLVSGERELVDAVGVEPAKDWYGPESDSNERWRWSSGRSTLRIRNGAGGPLNVTVRGRAAALDERKLRILDGDAMVWSGVIERKPRTFTFGLVVPEGGTTIRFESDKAWVTTITDTRRFSFKISDLEVVVTPPTRTR